MTHAHWRRRPGSPPLILGHRGARARAPENTLAAFELALDEGADGVELDVRFDGEGEVVVLHDRNLERVTDARDTRDVEELQRSDLDQIDVGSGERVPRLSTVLDFIRGRRARVNVELKRDVRHPLRLARRVAALVAGVPQASRHVILSSFDPRIVAALPRLVPEVPVGWLVHAEQRLAKNTPGRRWLGATAVHPDRLLCSPDRVRGWQRAGALVNVWTVNDPVEARDLSALGVDAIITDDPAEVISALSG